MLCCSLPFGASFKRYVSGIGKRLLPGTKPDILITLGGIGSSNGGLYVLGITLSIKYKLVTGSLETSTIVFAAYLGVGIVNAPPPLKTRG